MDSNTLISSLVETYKELNIRFRGAADSPEAQKIVARMRDDEAAFSQALKDHLLGIGTDNGERAAIVDGNDGSLTQLISQFGTASATTLNLLKGIQDEGDWNKSAGEGKTIRDYVQDLVTSDANQLKKLGEILGA